jgi:hypothetical protein
MSNKRNTGGPHRPTPPYPAIDPNLLYPLRRLSDLGWGARALALAKRKGLRILAFSKWRYVKGTDLIEFLESIQPRADLLDSDTQSGVE